MRRYLQLVLRLIKPIADPTQCVHSVPRYLQFLRDMVRYSQMAGAEPIHLLDTYPCLHDASTLFDAHYFYQAVWAFERIEKGETSAHVDVGSDVRFVGVLSTICQVTFIDIRPLEANLRRLDCCQGSVLSLPFEDNSIRSLSCLHVLEHIGLGRYGDPLDTLGTGKAAKELGRVLARGGDLYVSLPVGRPRLCFNAHRIHSPEQALEYFGELQAVEISWVDDRGHYHPDADLAAMRNSTYACGLFRFQRL